MGGFSRYMDAPVTTSQCLETCNEVQVLLLIEAWYRPRRSESRLDGYRKQLSAIKKTKGRLMG